MKMLWTNYDGDHLRRRFYRGFVREFVFWIFLLFSLANAALMAGFLFAAAFEAAKACLTFVGWLPLRPGFSSPKEAGLQMGLTAVELVLLAPLGYLFVSALALFVKELVEKDGDAWLRALHTVIGIKALGTSLLISILAADFIGKILRESHMDILSASIELTVFLVLIGYLIVLERALPHLDHGQTSKPAEPEVNNKTATDSFE